MHAGGYFPVFYYYNYSTSFLNMLFDRLELMLTSVLSILIAATNNIANIKKHLYDDDKEFKGSKQRYFIDIMHRTW
jgi:hypothetical protein